MQSLKVDDVEISRLDRSHEDAVRGIFREGLSDRFMFNGPFDGDMEELTSAALAALDGGDSFLMGGFIDGTLIGVVPCAIRGPSGALEVHLHLAKAYRGRAIASGFIRKTAKAFSEVGYQCFVWGPVAHQAAKTVYFHAGFREVAVLPGMWDLGDGKRCDVGIAIWGGK